MSKSDYRDLISQVDQLIRAGQGVQARRQILQLKGSSHPREHLVPIAQLARRLGLNHFGLQAMRPMVRPSQPLLSPASEQERSVYASLLVKIGALREAFNIFESLDGKRNPEILLYQCYGHMAQWEYGKAINLLEKYLRCKTITDYQRLIARVNLGTAHVAELQHEQALKLLEKTSEECLQHENWLLLGASFEAMAQSYLLQGDYESAKKTLLLSKERLSHAGGLHLFFVDKWMGVISYLEKPNKKESQQLIMDLRTKATEMRHWETLRECDFFESLATLNTPLYLKVYFGTPHEGYRKRMQRLTPFEVPLPKHYDYSPGTEQAKSPARILDIALGKEVDQVQQVLKKGRHPLQLLQLFSRDFYRPFRSGDIFNELYQTSYFDPVSTPQRIAKSIKELRKQLSEAEVPLAIVIDKGEYRLQARAPYTLRVTAPIKTRSTYELDLLEIKDKFPYQSFSAKNALEVLRTSQRSTNRFLKWAVDHRRIHPVGQGRSRLYKCCK